MIFWSESCASSLNSSHGVWGHAPHHFLLYPFTAFDTKLLHCAAFAAFHAFQRASIESSMILFVRFLFSILALAFIWERNAPFFSVLENQKNERMGLQETESYKTYIDHIVIWRLFCFSSGISKVILKIVVIDAVFDRPLHLNRQGLPVRQLWKTVNDCLQWNSIEMMLSIIQKRGIKFSIHTLSPSWRRVPANFEIFLARVPRCIDFEPSLSWHGQ